MPLRISPLQRLLIFIAVVVAGLGAILYSVVTAQSVRPSTAETWSPVDLARQGWYARQVFSEADRNGFDPAAPGVRAVAHFPIRLNALFAIPPGTAVNDFALMTTVDLPPAALAQPLILRLPELGENWALYINGVEIRREIYLAPDGQMQLRRSLQQALIPLPAAALQPGPNRVVFRMLGSAPPTPFFTNWLPGFSIAEGYLIAPASRLLLERSRQDAVSWFQVGAYLFFAMVHLLLFWRQRELYALYFGIFLVTCAAYSLFASSLMFDLLPDTTLLIRLFLAATLSWPALIGLTLWDYLYRGQAAPRLLRLLSALLLVGCGLMGGLPFPWTGLVMELSMWVLLASATYVMNLVIGAVRQGRPDSGKILAACLLIFAMLIWTVLDVLVVRTGLDVISWAPFFLAVAFATIFINRLWHLATELAESNRQLTLSRDHLEEQVAERSAELRAANADLEHRVEARTAELSARTVELGLARDAAEAGSRAKSAFLAIMGHELRTPLHGIFLTAELLRERHLSQGDQTRYAEIILASGRRLLRMVEGVLEYTAADTPLQLPVDVALALDENAVRFKPRAARQGLTLTFDVAAPLPPLAADPRQFDRMLQRLLDNAIKFTPAGGCIRVAARRLLSWPFAAGARPALEITVFNSGPVFQPADYQRMFEPFVQLEASHLEHAEGAGLGLTLARRQAEAHAGTLTAEPAPDGQGHLFTLRLPYGLP